MPMPFGRLGKIVCAALGRRGAVKITRYDPGVYNDSTGHWNSGSSSELTFDGHVQPAGHRERLQLPENERHKEAIAVYTVEPLKSGNVSTGEEADVIHWSGKDYRVSSVLDWEAQAVYGQAVAVKLGE